MIIEFKTEPFNSYIKGQLEKHGQFRVDKTLVFGFEEWNEVRFTYEDMPIVRALDYCREYMEPYGIVPIEAWIIERRRLM